jgi:hypothetical protein
MPEFLSREKEIVDFSQAENANGGLRESGRQLSSDYSKYLKRNVAQTRVERYRTLVNK